MELSKIHVDLTNIFSQINETLQNSQTIKELLDKNFQLDIKTRELIEKFIFLLSTTESETLKLMTVDFQRIFSDGIIDLSDIPIMVKIITDILNSKSIGLKSFTKSPDNVGVLIKIIILVLGRLEVFTNFDESKVIKMVDSSIALLQTTISVSNGFGCC